MLPPCVTAMDTVTPPRLRSTTASTCISSAYTLPTASLAMAALTAALSGTERQRRRRAKLALVRRETRQRECVRAFAVHAASTTCISEAERVATQLAAEDTTEPCHNARAFAEATQQDAVHQPNLQPGRQLANRAPFAASDRLTNATSLAERITVAKAACHAPSKVVGQAEVGTQCSLPLADKSVGCSFKACSESKSVQATEAVDQSSSTSASKPSISPSTAKCDNTQQGCLHQCHLCDYATDKPFRLEAHTKVHTGKHLFQCHLCPLSFSKRNTLHRHLFIHTGGHPFKCPSCPRSFSKKVALNRHLYVHGGERPFQCSLCLQSFSQKSHLKEHLRTHTGEKPFQCPSCPQSFSHKSSMKHHLRTHTGEKPFQCPSCPQSFSHKSSMKKHLRTHTGEKPFQCPSCPRSFSRKSIMKEHLRTHTGEKPFQCPSCPWSFSRKCSMKEHLRTHTGEKPFQCPSCPQSFSRKSSMKEHLRIHTGVRPYRCTVCSESFVRADYLSRHKRTQHHSTVD
ncbi:gastrula zinc finger protein XlCGF57.1-like isoform X2 [Dermacentor albipictus]|uniref:gastrula zinc finger protein XlCGF57.1-like isoform X2 n=1 Tax=Dermacentor albipictus TaxID=60249 RepID=UPI0031FC1D83